MFWSRLCVSCSGLAKPGEMVLVLGCPGSGCTTFLKAIANDCSSVVGDEFVRGISGGERKRVSIAEMMSTRAPVRCWDNPTRGLDASTALDFVRSLRIMTDVSGQTNFVTLYAPKCGFNRLLADLLFRYQASEGIYNLFDRVLVLDKGRQIYLGPPSRARSYFEELGFKSVPRQPTADYLTGCTDPNERQFTPGRSITDVPSIPVALEQAFLESELAVDLRHELEEYKMSVKDEQELFRRAVLLDKKRGVSEHSPYTLGYAGQVMALARRQFQMRLQDRFQLATSLSLSVVCRLLEGLTSSDQTSRSFPLLLELHSSISQQHQMARLLVPASFSSAC